MQGGAVMGALALAPRAAFALPGAAEPVAKTKAGRVRGRVVGNGIVCFKGIPYGMDTAKTRFAAPKAADSHKKAARGGAKAHR